MEPSTVDTTVQYSSTYRTIDFLADKLDPESAHSQVQSPLFSVLPAEIRTRIFSYAFSESPNPKRRYEPGSFAYRPGLECAPTVSHDLLLTCRRIYLEVSILAAQNIEFRYYWGRPPPDVPSCGRPGWDLARLAAFQREHACFHFYVQQFLLETSLGRFVLLDASFRPAHLMLTLRHGDWWFWENKAPLALDPGAHNRPSAVDFSRPQTQRWPANTWGHALGCMPSLKTLVMELETVAEKQTELDEIVQRAKKWAFGDLDDEKRATDGELGCVPSATRISGWDGIDRFYELDNSNHSAWMALNSLNAQDESDPEDEEDEEEDEESDDGFDNMIQDIFEHQATDDNNNPEDGEGAQADGGPQSTDEATAGQHQGDAVDHAADMNDAHMAESLAEEIHQDENDQLLQALSNGSDTHESNYTYVQHANASAKPVTAGSAESRDSEEEKASSHKEPSPAPEKQYPKLKYYVVTLTWKRKPWVKSETGS